MPYPPAFTARVGGWFVAVGVLVTIGGAPVEATTLFPEPLHIVREVHDSISGTTTTLHEYCAGDRIVTVNGSLVAISDYGRQELTEIDRSSGTFSITSFADVARASSPTTMISSADTVLSQPRILGVKRTADGRQVESFEFIHAGNGERTVIAVAVDRQISLSADAIRVLIGAAFPNRRTFAHDAILRSASSPSTGTRMQTTSAESLSLPSEHTITYEAAGDEVTFRSTIKSITRETVPADILSIPPGSRRVESRVVTVPRTLQEIEGLSKPPPR